MKNEGYKFFINLHKDMEKNISNEFNSNSARLYATIFQFSEMKEGRTI